MKYIKYIVVFFIVLFIMIWLCSLLKCEINTYKHGKEFEHMEQIDPGNGTIKVLDYSDDYARIYYKTFEYGIIYKYKKYNNKWCFEEWGETVWSRRGSADGFIWPYGR